MALLSSVSDLLESGEEVEESTSPSRFDSRYFKWHMIALVFLILGAVSGFTSLVASVLPSPSTRWLFAGFFGAIFFLVFLATEIRRYFVGYYFTDRKLIEEVGIFSKDVKTVRYDNITDTHLDKDFMERIFGLGDLRINTAGSDLQEVVLTGLSNPEHYKTLISRKSSEREEDYSDDFGEDRGVEKGREERRDEALAEDTGGTDRDIQSRIGELEMKKSQLEEMFDRGELSKEDYWKEWYIIEGRMRELKEQSDRENY